jgi:hypothetical protein
MTCNQDILVFLAANQEAHGKEKEEDQIQRKTGRRGQYFEIDKDWCSEGSRGNNGGSGTDVVKEREY